MINLIFTKVAGENLFAAYQITNAAADANESIQNQRAMEYFNDVNEFKGWVEARGGWLGSIVQHPVDGRCRLATIEAITVNDAVVSQIIYDFKSTDFFKAQI